MPELPEVEVVRLGLERGVAGRTVRDVEVTHARAVRRHTPGAADFVSRLVGRTILEARRRGKYLWLPLDSGEALTGHLGMSGQLLVVPAEAPLQRHAHVRLDFCDGGRELRFVDQRTFGGLLVVAGGDPVPPALAHVARDPLDPLFDDEAFVAAVRRRRTGIKRALLDQRLVSGIGNIYADETLWRARLHGERPTEALTRPAVRRLLGHAREVMSEAITQGDELRRAVRLDRRGERAVRAVPRGLRATGRAVPEVRHPDPAGGLHEPLVVQLPPLPNESQGWLMRISAWTAGGVVPSCWRGPRLAAHPLRAAAAALEQLLPVPGRGRLRPVAQLLAGLAHEVHGRSVPETGPPVERNAGLASTERDRAVTSP